MGAGTYPNSTVESYIVERFIPVQFNVDERPEVMEEFNTSWTPTLIVQDSEGREHRRCQGYLDPKRFLGEMSLAWLQDAINRRDLTAAHERAAGVLGQTKGDPAREPEAIYWSGVTGYKVTNDVNNLFAQWNRLLDEFPGSEWAKRVEFIRPQGT